MDVDVANETPVAVVMQMDERQLIDKDMAHDEPTIFEE